MIGDKLPHIGIVTHIKSEKWEPDDCTQRGRGQVLEDCLPRFGKLWGIINMVIRQFFNVALSN